jgi:hypothetical protein
VDNMPLPHIEGKISRKRCVLQRRVLWSLRAKFGNGFSFAFPPGKWRNEGERGREVLLTLSRVCDNYTPFCKDVAGSVEY